MNASKLPKRTLEEQKFLTGTYTAFLDNKKRIHIPKQLKSSLTALNGGENRLYLQTEVGKINVFPTSAISKVISDFEAQRLIDPTTRKKMERFASTLYETTIPGDGRIKIPDEALNTLNIKRNDKIRIKGAFKFITISKY